MDAIALLLVVAAALAHATWNVAAKASGGDARFALLADLLLLALWAPVAYWFGRGVVGGWGGREWGIIAVSAVVHVGYFLALLRGYRAADLTVVYPVARGAAPLLAAAVAIAVLGEPLTPAKAAGIGTIVAGVFLIAGGPALLRATHEPAARARVLAGMRWGAVTGVLIAAYTVIDGVAV